jgi:membrane protease YdiL (CAAX protease family)
MSNDPVKAFFVLTFALSWLCWLPAVAGYDGPLAVLLLFAGVWGPAAAAATIVGLSKRSVKQWFRGLFVWRVPHRWYGFALGVPILLIGFVSVPFVLLGHDLDGSLLGGRLAIYVPMLIFLSLAGGGNEELGWRGFALPELLRRHTPVRASLILGGLWALWHLPLLGAADDLTHGLGGVELTLVLVATVLNIIGLAFIYTHLYQRTRSALLCVLLHGSFNAANGTLVLREEIEGDAYAAMQYCMTATTLLAAVALVWWTHGRLGTDRNHPDQERAPALATARTEIR